MQQSRAWFFIPLSLLALPTAAIAQSPQPSPQYPGWRKVDGRKEPQALPDHLVWEWGLGALVRAATDDSGAFSDRQMTALSKYTLSMSTSDVRRVVESAHVFLKRVDEIRQPLNDEHGSGKSLGWSKERRLETIKMAEQEVLKGKADLQSRLSPQAFKALQRWITQSSFGTVAYVPE